MVRSIDHVVIAVRDLAQAVADYERAGFTVTLGGEHAGGATHNALISFADGAYLELIAFKEPDRPQPHRWWDKLRQGEGLVDFALLADDLAAEADRLTAAGLAVDGPDGGGRTRPDGQEVAWRGAVLPAAAGFLPFLIEDVTPRELRVPGGAATAHALGATGVAGVTVVVADLDRSAADFAKLLGQEGASAPERDGVRAARRFAIGPHWVDLAQPDDPDGDLGRHLAARGDGPFALVLRAATGRELSVATTHGARIGVGE